MHDIRLPVRATMVGLALSLALGACGTPAATSEASTPPAGSAAAGSRPSSPAVVAIVAPSQNAVVTGATVHIELSLKNAKIVQATTTNITPDEGHVHLYLDNVIVSMNYQLSNDLPVQPGTHSLKAEFVASDHAPFNPRVWSDTVVIKVQEAAQ